MLFGVRKAWVGVLTWSESFPIVSLVLLICKTGAILLVSQGDVVKAQGENSRRF